MESAHQTITLGGGCFWCLETVFNRLRGVGFFCEAIWHPLQKYYFNFMWPQINICGLADAFIVLRILETLRLKPHWRGCGEASAAWVDVARASQASIDLK